MPPDNRTAADKAVEVGGLANKLRTQVTLGTCEFNLGSLASARKTFTDVRRAARRDKDRRVERMAGDWINYIDSEQKRRDELAKVGL